ncbi:hypothetical protein TERMP_00257 [Thermococcus barophilus MP]|uniref:Uncharacterized protein n=1 Tax=Thermococcus barophilus (strain DSM 11836 / MP) TaxID=391623 RepID=F0LI80_THEBM|nr:hypothetical protein TERMP_00257 [Thermococcus barophilus MP]
MRDMEWLPLLHGYMIIREMEKKKKKPVPEELGYLEELL